MRFFKPFNLNGPLFVWNVMFALFSIVGTIRTGEEFLNVMKTQHPIYNSICVTYDPNGVTFLYAFLFISSKIIEFGDTAFIVLRKKPLGFLHWLEFLI